MHSFITLPHRGPRFDVAASLDCPRPAPTAVTMHGPPTKAPPWGGWPATTYTTTLSGTPSGTSATSAASAALVPPTLLALRRLALLSCPPSPSPVLPTSPLGTHVWAPSNRACLEAWILGLHQRPFAIAPAAVFDWDDTCFAGDTAAVAFNYVLDNLALQLTPEALAGVLPEALEGGTHFADGVCMADLRADILAAYAQLWPLVQSARGRESAVPAASLPTFRTLAAYHDFRAKAAAYYIGVESTPALRAQTSYFWVRFLAGYSVSEAGALILRAFELAAREPKGFVVWESATAGRAGRLRYKARTGCGAQDEMRALMDALRHAGVKPFIVSGNLDVLVRPLVAHLGFPVPASRIFATQAELDATQRLTGNTVAPHVWEAGKTDCIRAHILPHAPLLVAGDSDGDMDMLTAFDETEVRLVINHNRPKTSRIASLAEAASGEPVLLPSGRYRWTLLQGKDIATGRFVPTQETVSARTVDRAA